MSTGKVREKDTDKGGQSVFDKMVEALMQEQSEEGLLDDCMTFDMKVISKVPLRYRIIALGFVRKSTLQEVNETLKSQGCAALYSRSLWEASLIYAFYNGLTYSEWKDLQETCRKVRAERELKDKFFVNSRISLHDIREYVEANSVNEGQKEVTLHVTRANDIRIQNLSLENLTFQDFLQLSFETMSVVREKTRYYFCKYMMYYLTTSLERYLAARQEGQTSETMLEDLAIFKGVTGLRRKKMTDEEVRVFLEDAGVSFGAIFDAFNYYYFDYVSLDWMEVLLDYYGNFALMPEEDRNRLAKSLRNYDPAGYADLSDDEILEKKQAERDAREELLDDIYSRDGNDKGYQRNRAGENTLRKYVKGGLDIDRTTLICFLIFFGNNADLPDEYKITRGRLDDMLVECGFAGLREEDDFDAFIIEFISSDDPVSLLMNEVTDYALGEENFYLYKMYHASRSAEEDINKLT